MVMPDGFAWNGQTYDKPLQSRFRDHRNQMEWSALFWH